MKHLEVITLLFIFSSCESKQETKINDGVPWDKNKNVSESTDINIEHDSLALNKSNLITYFETKRDHTLVEINKIEFECVNKKGKEQTECLAELNKKQQEINKKIEELKKSTEESTDKLKNALDSAFVDLEEFIEKAKEKFKK